MVARGGPLAGRALTAVMAAVVGGAVAAPRQAAAVSAPLGAQAALPKHTTARVAVAKPPDGFDTGDSVAVSANGRYVVFTSAARLVRADSNGQPDVYVRDRWTGTTRRVSVPSVGGQFRNAWSYRPSVSADGRYVAFVERNLKTGIEYVRVRDLERHVTRTASINSRGAVRAGADPSISADGRFVAFDSPDKLVPGDTNERYDVYVRDLRLHRTTWASHTATGRAGNGDSGFPQVVAADGLVYFETWATNLTANHRKGIVAWRRNTASTRWHAPLDDVSEQDYAASADGRLIAYLSRKGCNRACIREKDVRTGRSWIVSVGNGGAPIASLAGDPPAISAHGRYVAWTAERPVGRQYAPFPGQLWLRDRQRRRTSLVSVATDGQPGNVISGAGGSYGATMSPDGRFVGFYSASDNLVAHDTNRHVDAFIRRMR